MNYRGFIPDSIRRGMKNLFSHQRLIVWLPPVWRYLAVFIIAAFVLFGWTWYSLRSRAGEVFAARRIELVRTASNRAVLLNNWLIERQEDAQDLATRLWTNDLLRPPPSPSARAAAYANSQERMNRFAAVYGYTSVAVLNRSGTNAGSSAAWDLTPAETLPLLHQVDRQCAPALGVVRGRLHPWILLVLAPVLPSPTQRCVPADILGYVAVAADAHSMNRLHFHLTPPPYGIDFLFVLHGGRVSRFIQFDSDRQKGFFHRPSAEEDMAVRLALSLGDGFHVTSENSREYWLAVQSVPLVHGTAIAYINRNYALADYRRTRSIWLSFDILILLLIAGVLIALNLRVRARTLSHELEIQTELARLRQYSRRIVEDSPVGLVVVDGNWRIVSINRAFRRMAGIADSSEPLHDRVADWIDVDPVGPLQRWHSCHVHEGVGQLHPRNGRVRPIHVILSELTEAAPDGGQYLLTIEDLSQRQWMEERYRHLFEQNMAGIVQTTLSGEIIGCNDAYARMLGYESRLDLLAHSVLPAYRHPEDRNFILSELRHAGRLDGFEVELVRRDGGSVWTLVNASMLVDIEGDLPILQKTFVDITQRRLAQETIEKQARLLDLTLDAVIATDLKGNIRYWNQGARLLYGWSSEEVLGKNLHVLLRSELPNSLDEINGELLQHGRWEGEIRQKCHDDHEVDVFSRWVLQRGAQNEPNMILVTNSDITQRKAAETALAASNQRILEIFNSIGEGFLALDDKWCFTYVNHEAERLLRKPKAEMLGRAIWDVFPLFKTSAFYEYCNEARQKKVRVEFEEYSQSLGIWLEVHAYPVAPGLSLYFRDVSERRNLRIRLRQAEKMDAVGRLAGGIAHDFNNILNVIAGYAELLTQTLEPNSKQGQYANEIVNASLRAGALTRQLLAFGRRQHLSPRVLNLNAVLSEMKPLVQRLIGEDIELTAVQDSQLGNVQADSTQIEQVILNLAANARDAMPNGGKLLIETSNLDLEDAYEDDQVHLDPGSYVLLSVTDTGAGMDPSVRARIFEPFFTTKDVGKGTGLGLSTVDGVVQQSGGTIWVYSRPGLGTTFKVYLPRVMDKEETPAAAPARPPEAIRGGNESILLVEDEESLRAFVREVLEGYGYRVVSAGSGLEALRLFSDAGPFQIVVTDVVMPGMGGAELVRQVLNKDPMLKVLYMSGYTGRAMLRQGRLQPGSRFLAKPFSAQHLARSVRACLDQPAAEQVIAET